ncbi:hypothetical protein PV05_09868 [Exophiala xenobiotica]|uniref:Uncharacterized protein n=1 Tax=Exophiala xenobiotica TaxID=348802 RepID=A0A0D2CMN7_9EURO|nr:uncharacterized protein PV05_09868 [Exophiala xenobiotica]KIW51117.1 hypothetical protein PV05_09868 [Exophiala xenobiotica]
MSTSAETVNAVGKDCVNRWCKSPGTGTAAGKISEAQALALALRTEQNMAKTGQPAPQSRAVQCRAEQSSAEQSRAVQSRAVQSRAEQSRAVQSRAVQSRAEQCRAVQSRAEQCRAEQRRAEAHFSPRRKKKWAGPDWPRRISLHVRAQE